jgi:hypothetical protein
MIVLNLYILVIRICFGFRYSNFVLVLNNFEFTPSEIAHIAQFAVFADIGTLRKNSYEIFSKLCKTNPIFPHFSPKKEDSYEKQSQTNPMLIWVKYS